MVEQQDGVRTLGYTIKKYVFFSPLSKALLAAISAAGTSVDCGKGWAMSRQILRKKGRWISSQVENKTRKIRRPKGIHMLVFSWRMCLI